MTQFNIIKTKQDWQKNLIYSQMFTEYTQVKLALQMIDSKIELMHMLMKK